MTSLRLTPDTKYFVTVRDEKGKKRRIPVTGQHVGFNYDIDEGRWIEGFVMAVEKVEIQNEDEIHVPLEFSNRHAEMTIR